MSKASLPTYLRTYRKRAGLSQREVAFLIGTVSSTTVSRHESARRAPSLADALFYEALFGVPASALFPRMYEHARSRLEARAIALLGRLAHEATDETAKRPKQAFLRELVRRVRM